MEFPELVSGAIVTKGRVLVVTGTAKKGSDFGLARDQEHGNKRARFFRLKPCQKRVLLTSNFQGAQRRRGTALSFQWANILRRETLLETRPRPQKPGRNYNEQGFRI
jgi:hypothetical protein